MTLYVSVIVAVATLVFRRRDVGERVVMATLRTLAAIAIGISVFVTGLGITLAFGMFAFIGMPVLIIGLGLLSAAIDDIEGG